MPWFVACCAHSPGLRHPAAVAAWHLSVCLGCGRRRASLACLVAPRGAPRLVRFGRSRCFGRLSRRRGAFPSPGGLRPRLYWVAARGRRRPAENRADCACRWPPPRQGRWARSASYPFRAPRWGCPWRVPLALVLGCVRCGGWRVWTRSRTRPVSRTVCRSTGDSPGALQLFRVDADTAPCGSEDATPGSRACVRVVALLGLVGRAGLPGAFWCALPFPLTTLSFCFAWRPPGWGCPCLGPLFALPSPLLLFFPLFFSSLVCAPLVSGFLWFPALGALGLGAVLCVFFLPPATRLFVRSRLFCVSRLLVGCSLVVAAPPHSPCVSRGFRRCRSLLCFFYFLPVCAPVVSGVLWSPAPGALGLGWALAPCFVCFVGLPLPRSPYSLASFVCPAWPLAAPWWLLPPPPPPLLCLAVFVAAARCSFLFFFFSLSCVPPLSLAFSGFRPRVPWSSALCVVCFVGLPLLGSPCALPSSLLSAWLLAAPWWLLPPPPPLCLTVFVAAARCCVPCAVLCCVSLGAVLRRAAARCAARCCAVVCCVSLLRSFGAAACCALPSGAARRPGALCSAALCFALFPRAVCSVLCVFCRGVVVRAVVRRSALCCVCPGVLCCVFPFPSALCGAVLRCAAALALCCSCGACCCSRLVLWCAAVCCAVSFGVLWCGAGSGGPWLSAGGVFLCRCPCLAAWSASLWLVWFAVVPCFPVSCSVVLCCRVVLCCCALLSCCGAVGASFAPLWPVVLCCVVLLVGCAVFCPAVVSACCGALSLVLCVPCLLRPVRCCALLCWLWCPASLCRVLWRCAVAWCCAVVLCCSFAVLFVLALPSCGLSCGAVLCCVVLLVVCAVFCPVVAFVCFGALSLPASTHKKHQLSPCVTPRPSLCRLFTSLRNLVSLFVAVILFVGA